MIKPSKVFFVFLLMLILTFSICTSGDNQEKNKENTIDNKDNIVSIERDYTDSKVINSKEEAFELLKKSRLKLNDEIYKYSGIDEYNGYIYSYKGNDSINNYPTFIVNPYTGNVYDEVSSWYITSLNIKNDNNTVLTVDEIEDLLINKNIVELSDNTLLQFYSHEAGDVIIALFKKEDYEIISAFRVNPLNGNVYNYSTGGFINNIRNPSDIKQAEITNFEDFDKINVKVKKFEEEIEVNKSIYQKKEVSLDGYSTEGGFAEGYYLDNNLKYIESIIYGEMGKVAYDVYFIDDNLTLFVKTLIMYDKPIYEDDFKIVEEKTAKYVILEEEVLEFNETSKTLNEVKSSDEIKESVNRITESLEK